MVSPCAGCVICPQRIVDSCVCGLEVVQAWAFTGADAGLIDGARASSNCTCPWQLAHNDLPGCESGPVGVVNARPGKLVFDGRRNVSRQATRVSRASSLSRCPGSKRHCSRACCASFNPTDTCRFLKYTTEAGGKREIAPRGPGSDVEPSQMRATRTARPSSP